MKNECTGGNMRKSKVELLEDRIAEIKLNCKHIDVIPIEVTTETLSVYVGGAYDATFENHR